jgi:hypothetical protein
MGLRVSNEVIYAKTEVTYNTDPTPTTSDAILTRGRPTFASEGLRQNERSAIRASLGTLQSVFGGTLKKISFECEVKGSGTAGTAPEIGPLIEACGLNEVIVASTSVTYRPESASHESVTIYWFEGGRKRHILTGCRGNVTFRLEAGGIMVAAFEFTGHWSSPDADFAVPSPTYDSTVPRAAIGMTVSIDGDTTLSIRSWEWMLGNTIALPPSLAAADGYGEVMITSRNVTGQVVMESELFSVFDDADLILGGGRFDFASGLLGSTAGNRVQITTASRAYVTDSSVSEADGIALRTLELAVDDSTVDTEIAVVFT